jgi:hypothetical protein
VGPWRAVRDHIDPTTAAPDLLYAARNMITEDPAIGGGWVSRPGFELASDGDPLGTLGARVHQAIGEFERRDGTIYRVAIVNGQFYTYDWTTATFTEQSLGSLTIDAGATHVYLVTFADRLIISDGVNRPIAWDGSTFAELTACPVLFGRPWIYYAKLFGIRASDPTEFVWSEEEDPTIGYDVGGYNNAWRLIQTDSSALRAGLGFNDGMVLLRARSGTIVTGAVGTEFQSTGTREGLSETIGSESPAALTVAGRNIFFLDADRRPQLLTIDGGIRGAAGSEQPLWSDARETIKNIPANSSAAAIGVYHPLLDVVLFGVPALGETRPTFWLEYDALTGDFLGTWTGFSATAAGVWTDLEGKPRLVHGDTDGYTYVHGLPGGAVYDDGFAAGAEAIDHYIETGPIGYDTKQEKIFDRVDVSVRALTELNDVELTHRTSKQVFEAVALTFAGGQAVWDAGLWDVAQWSTESAEQHGDVGTAAWGRYTYVQLQHRELGESFGAMKVTVLAHVLGPTPGVR